MGKPVFSPFDTGDFSPHIRVLPRVHPISDLVFGLRFGYRHSVHLSVRGLCAGVQEGELFFEELKLG